MKALRAQRTGLIALLATATLVLAACGTDEPTGTSTDQPREHRTMNVLSLTGTTGEQIADAFKGFEEKYNVTINWVGGASAENIAKLKATAAKPEYDNAVLDDLSAYSASTQGLLAKLDESKIPHIKDMFDVAKTPNNDGVAWGAVVTGIFYNTDTFKQKNLPVPKAWTDLLKPELCKGIGMANFSGSSTLKATMMLGNMTKNGSNTDAAVKDGLTKLKTVGGCVETFEASVGALDTKIQSNFYSHGVQPSSSIVRMKAGGLPMQFVVPTPGTVGVFTTAVPVKDAPNAELSQLFIDWFLTPEVQTNLAQVAYYSPLNKTVKLDQKLLDLGVPGPDVIANLYTPDYAVVTKERANWSATFDREVAGK